MKSRTARPGATDSRRNELVPLAVPAVIVCSFHRLRAAPGMVCAGPCRRLVQALDVMDVLDIRADELAPGFDVVFRMGFLFSDLGKTLADTGI